MYVGRNADLRNGHVLRRYPAGFDDERSRDSIPQYCEVHGPLPGHAHFGRTDPIDWYYRISDYFVRIITPHKYTWATPTLLDTDRDWNRLFAKEQEAKERPSK